MDRSAHLKVVGFSLDTQGESFYVSSQKAREDIEPDLEKAIVKNIILNKTIQATPLSKEILEILSEGGILSLLKDKIRAS